MNIRVIHAGRSWCGALELVGDDVLVCSPYGDLCEPRREVALDEQGAAMLTTIIVAWRLLRGAVGSDGVAGMTGYSGRRNRAPAHYA